MTYNEKLRMYEDVQPYRCCNCGKEETACYLENKRMVDKQFCFTCNFWDKHATDDINVSIRIDGVHYMTGDGKSPFKGFGGQHFVIKMNDGRIIETNDLWLQGTIPDNFINRLPDNAVFLTQ